MFDSQGISLKSLLFLFLVVLVSCSDDDGPTRPTAQFEPTLETLWPHADGNSWTYDLKTEDCEHPESAFFETLNEVPPIPPFEELYARLKIVIPCDQPEISSGSLNRFFDGEVAISPEDTVQRLRSIVEADEGWPSTPFQLGGGLWALREDRIVAGPDWKNDDWISWVYLSAELEPGDEFSFQLSPQYSDDLFGYLRIWRHVKHMLPGQGEKNCVECFYLVDTGIQQATDENGQSLGYCRSYIYGVVLYGENIGPILCREQREGARISEIHDPSGSRYTIDTLAYLIDWSVLLASP